MNALVIFLVLFLISFLATRTDASTEYCRIKIDGKEVFDVVIKIMFSEENKTMAKWFQIQSFLVSNIVKLIKINQQKRIFIALGTHCSPVAYDIEPRIYYGENVTIEEYPFFAGIQTNDNASNTFLVCGASIISETWILTAAHCLADINPKNIDPSSFVDVYVGGATFADSMKFRYKRFIKHEEYRKDKNAVVHDVAVIELNTPLKFSKKIQPIKLPTKPVTNSKWVFVARGRTEDAYIAVNLQKVDLIRYPIDQCYIPLSKGISLDKDLFKKITICATREGHRPSICAGDSGSPLISDKTIVGIASYMKNEPCYEARIGYYTNVSYYVPWIKNVTGLSF